MCLNLSIVFTYLELSELCFETLLVLYFLKSLKLVSCFMCYGSTWLFLMTYDLFDTHVFIMICG